MKHRSYNFETILLPEKGLLAEPATLFLFEWGSTYSLFKLFTGLASAALMDWKLTVAKAIMIEIIADAANTHH